MSRIEKISAHPITFNDDCDLGFTQMKCLETSNVAASEEGV